MTQRSFKKYANLGLDEEKDFFLAGLNKRIRNARKKLEQIDELSKKDKSTLKTEQLEKIKSRSEVLESIKYVDDVKEMYYASYKTAKEEGKLGQSATDNVLGAQSEDNKNDHQAVSEPQVEAQNPVQTQVQNNSQQNVADGAKNALAKVLNLVHFVQFFRDQGHVQEFKNIFDSQKEQMNVESVPDFESFYEFYTKVFTFSESDKFVRMEDKLNRSLNEIESYVNSAQQPALKNQTYDYLQHVVQKVSESSFFKEHKADVSTRQTKSGAEPSVIGSELKKGHEQTETAAPIQEKQKSPEKEAPKVSPVKEAKRDWNTVEDDDEEEEGLDKLREEHQQEVNYEGEGGRAVDENEKPYTSLRDKQAEVEQKQKTADDDWSTVTAKHKEKKEEKPRGPGGNRPYRGDAQRGDRGGQRRPRNEGEGDHRRDRKEEGQEGESNRGGRGGFRGGNRGGFQKKEGDEYKKKEGDTYQKKAGETVNKTTENQ